MPTAVEQIIFTAVPNGISAGNLQISVHVAPTLSGGSTGTLSDFSDFQNWPSLMSSEGHLRLTFTNTGKSVLGTARVAAMTTSVLRNDLWQALFSPASTIRYSARDAAEAHFATTPIVSYPSDQIASFLQSTYTALTVGSPSSYPSAQTLADSYGDLGFGGGEERNRLLGLWNSLAAARVTAPPSGGQIPYANNWSGTSIALGMAALRFYHMPPLYQLPPNQNVPPAPSLPTIDFHRALTFIGQHRTLQRALGLVFDVVVPITEITFGSSLSDFYVQAEPCNVDGAVFSSRSGVTYTPIVPRVQCDASSSVFQAHAASSQIVGRQLTLGDTTSFVVYEIDVDGGGLKTAQFADNLKLAQQPQSGTVDSQNGPAPDAPTAYAPPALRSSGLTVAAVNRGLAFAAALQGSAKMSDRALRNDRAVPDLTAEDLVTGYVLDVYDSTTKNWHSTAMRDVVYTAGSITLNSTPPDEPGLDSPPRSQTSPTDPSQNQFNVPANIIRWTGWSNAAPRPGNPLADDGTASSGPGSGPFDELTDRDPAKRRDAAAAAVRHGIRTPRACRRHRRQRSAADERLARVDRRQRQHRLAGGHVADEPRACGPAGLRPARADRLTRRIHVERLAAPGRVAQAARDPRHRQLSVLGARHSRPTGSPKDSPNCTASSTPAPAARSTGVRATYNLITPRESSTYPLSAQTTPSGSPLWEPITLTDAVPFLPDPLARGGTLFVLDGPLTGDSYQFDFDPTSGKSWPFAQPYGIVLAPGATQQATKDATARQLTFTLTPGDTVPLQLSSYVNDTDLPKLGMAWWIIDYYKGAANVPAALGKAIVSGLTWSITPYTPLELVYAVQKPLLTPVFTSMSPLKELGWTYAEIHGDITYSPKSTARTDLIAGWQEPVDNGPGTGAPLGPGLAGHDDAAQTIDGLHDSELAGAEGV